jgi:hypothetical protein
MFYYQTQPKKASCSICFRIHLNWYSIFDRADTPGQNIRGKRGEEGEEEEVGLMYTLNYLALVQLASYLILYRGIILG